MINPLYKKSIILAVIVFCCIILSAQDTVKYFSYLRKGDSLFQRSEIDSAIICFKSSLNHTINNESKLRTFLLISDAFRMQNFDSAQVYFDSVNLYIQNYNRNKSEIEYEYLHLQSSFLGDKGRYGDAVDVMSTAINKRLGLSLERDTIIAKSFNKIGTYYYYLGRFDSAQYYYKKALEISSYKKLQNSKEVATYIQNNGIMYARNGEFDLALEYFNKNLEINKNILEENDPAFARIFLNLGRMYQTISQYSKAIGYSQEAEKIYINKFGGNYVSLGVLYLNIGLMHYELADFDKAELFYNNALRIFNINFDTIHPNISKIYNNLALLYLSKNRYQLALDHFKRSLKIATDPEFIIINLRNIAYVYSVLGKEAESESNYLLAISKAKLLSSKHYELGQSYRRYGEFLFNKCDYNDAFKYFNLALDVFTEIFPKANVYSSDVNKLIGDCFVQKDKPGKALQYYQKALIYNDFDFDKSDIVFNPGIENTLSPENYISILLQKAKALALLYDKKTDKNLLTQSLECYKLAMNGYENLKSDVGEESKLYLANATRESFDFSFRILHDLYTKEQSIKFIEEAFSFSEKGKASVLLSAMKDVDAIKFSGIPQDLQELEKDIKEKISGYESLVYNEKNRNNPDSDKISLWDHKLFVLDQKHDSLLEEFESNYPSYYSLRHDINVNSISDVQAYLDEDQILIEYVLTDTLLYRFAINNDNALFDKIRIDSVFYKDINAMRYANMIDFSTHGMKEYKSFVFAANRLYEKLFGKIELSLDNKKLVIVPDGKLGYLPFESLVTDIPDFTDRIDYRNLSYLLKKVPVSYSYSSTLLLRETDDKSLEKSLIAFAPEYNSSESQEDFNERGLSLMDELDPLVFAQEEVKNINTVFKGDVYSGSQASESNFKNIVQDHGIIHLAMHTVLDDENPMHSKLVFNRPVDTLNDGCLNTYEIYELELNAQLAVLSACNTGSGKINRGEGIMSLSRGFIYAGVPSIVMTLWEIEDKSGSTIMHLFYRNLKEGQDKDVALQQAKIEYLNNSPQLRAHPYFWAAYVDIGDTQPIAKTFLSRFGTFLYLFVLIAIVWVVRYYLSNKKKEH